MASFTPNPSLDRDNSNSRDWAYQLGILPLNHHIVFTKEELILFLKQHNVQVGPNFTELAKLPKYATIGKLTLGTTTSASAYVESVAPQQPPASSSQKVSAEPAQPSSAPEPSSASDNVVYTSSGDAFRPSRRVRDLAGGGSAQISSLFSGPDETSVRPAAARVAPSWEQSPPAATSRRPVSEVQSQAPAPSNDVPETLGKYEGVPNEATFNNGFRPTRRVRVPGGTGGHSSITFD